MKAIETLCGACSNFERSPHDAEGGWCLQWSAEVPDDGWCHMAEPGGENAPESGCRDRYRMRCGVEAEDVIAAVMRNALKRGMTTSQAWDVGNAAKYLTRLGRKDDPERELIKAWSYLNHALTGEWTGGGR